MKSSRLKAEVLIVGAGPTGLVLALWLTKLGVLVRIIDKNTDAGLASRALIIQSRTLELYHQIGIADEVVSMGIPLEYVEMHKNGKAIDRVNLGTIGEHLTPYSFILSFPQDDHEDLLLRHLKQAGVHVERQSELLSFSQDKAKIRAKILHEGKEEVAEFKYLCGCDGAGSLVRKQLGMTFPGGTYKQRFFVADVQSPDELMSGLHLGISKEDFCLAFPVRSSKTLRLIGIVPKEPKHCIDIQFSQVEETVARNMRIKVDKVNWFSTYQVHHRVVPRLGEGRVFLAGDAAHIHSPVGGQGMNTGIGDAINLAWKLAAVIQGSCSEHILETYNLERLPFAKKLVHTTDRLFQIVTSSSFLGVAWRSFIFPHLFPFVFKHQRLRDYFFRFVSQMQINYRNSWLSIQGGSTAVRAGDRLPWVPMGTCDNFKPLTGLCWQVHVYGKASSALLETLKKHQLSLFEFAWSSHAKNQGLIEQAAYLIRPDGYISVIDVTPAGNQIEALILSIKN